MEAAAGLPLLHETHRCGARALLPPLNSGCPHALLQEANILESVHLSRRVVGLRRFVWRQGLSLPLQCCSCGVTLYWPQVNADLSHWVVVCERVFDCPAHQRINGSDDEWWPQVLSLVQLCLRASFTHTPPLSPLTGAQVAQHAHLLHARVAYREGPQVPDPSDAAWANEVAAHER